MEKKCLIYYMGEKGKLYDEYCREIEDFGFVYEKKIGLSSLDYDVARFSYIGDDFEKDIRKIETIDEKIFVEINKEYEKK